MKLSPDERAAFERRIRFLQSSTRSYYDKAMAARTLGQDYTWLMQMHWHRKYSAEMRNHLFMLIGEKP